MGYDVTYHPISEMEIKNWYFDRLQEIKDENVECTKTLAKSFEMHDFYIDKYIDLLHISITLQDDENEVFDKTHGFYIAIVQGFFRTYFYTRGSAFSFLIEDYPEFQKYTKTWQKILENPITYQVENRITENYSSGVYIPYDKLSRLYEDYNQDSNIKKKLDIFFSDGRINVFLKAVEYALEHKLGILEATEVVEPNPLDLNKSESYSNLFNCDKDGAILYRDVAMEQLNKAMVAVAEKAKQNKTQEEAPKEETLKEETPKDEMSKEDSPKEKAPEKKGFFARLFNRK